ncbi:MAG: PLP-dependent aspartate aminotransferase family protein [Hyphomicrobiaceae bacterium]
MVDKHLPKDVSRETIAAQAGGALDPRTGALVPPIHIASTFLRDPDNQYRSGLSYGRDDNPTMLHAESVLAALEGGERAFVFSSGMAAAVTLFLALEAPAHVIAPNIMYWGLRKWLLEDAPRFGISVALVDMAKPQNVVDAMRSERTNLVWIETPGNPMWNLTDISATANVAHAAGALVACDSTVATPVHTRPIKHGADVVMHSATKYLNGHSDVIAGTLVFREENALAQRVAKDRRAVGPIIGPQEAALLIRGMRTLHVRVKHQSASAMALAERLAAHRQIAEVLYPGLPRHAGHEIAARQMAEGYGGMLSIRVEGGEAAAVSVAANVAIWKRATSLGGVESLMEHRSSIEGEGSPVPRDLLRLSVGLECVDDLARDLEQTLDRL